MAKHHPDLIMCRKQPGIGMFEISDFCPTHCAYAHLFLSPAAVGRCARNATASVQCALHVTAALLVRICDECNYGSYQVRPNDPFIPPNCRSFPSCLLMVVSTVQLFHRAVCGSAGGPGISDAYYCKECTNQEKMCAWAYDFPTRRC